MRDHDARRRSEAELLVAAPTDVAAFSDIYRRYVRRVTAFAATRCSDADDVADVVAQTFVELLEAARRYDPSRAEPASFVFGVAANVARDVNRARARNRTLVLKLSGRDLLDHDDTERIVAGIDAAQDARRVGEALRQVPPAEQAMVQRVVSGRTPGQAAEDLGISPGAGWTRLSRARSRLRLHLPKPTNRSDS